VKINLVQNASAKRENDMLTLSSNGA